MDLREKNLETLKDNYYLSFVDERVLNTLSEAAAKQGLNIYVYVRGYNAKWGLSTELRVIVTEEERKDKVKDWKGKFMYDKYTEIIFMPRAYVARTPRGALWRYVLEAIDYLDKLGKEEVEEVIEN